VNKSIKLLNAGIKKLKPRSKWFWWVFLICVIPRVILLFTNDQCNDDHMTPVMMWQENGEYPGAYGCWECFQPPLFYFIIKTIATPLNITDWMDLYYLIQIFNFIIAIGSLFLILRLIESFKLQKWLSISIMLFFGLNPELISIGALATNDTIIIFTGFILVHLFINFWKSPNTRTELIITAIIALASITKGNAMVFAFGFAFLLFMAHIKQRDWRISHLGKQLLMFVFLFFFVGNFGNYFKKHQELGNAFTINQIKPEPPNFYTPDTTFNGRAGVSTVFDSYFKMQFISLLEQPYNINHGPNYPLHRTSFWGQLYGQYSNYLFERYPSKWVSINNDHFNFTRVNYILHLPLLLILVLAFFGSLRKQFSSINTDLIHLALITLFLFFVARYSYIYRDFSNMKLIFLFPVAYSFIVLFLKQVKKVKYQKLLTFLFLSCSLLYQVSFIYLIRELIR
jgi:hypothetical protein